MLMPQVRVNNTKSNPFLFILLTIILVSCGEGYEKVDGQWAWVSHNEGGKVIRKIETDDASFEISTNKKYASDKDNVYWKGLKMIGADPKTFEIISNDGYSKDVHHVYLENGIVLFAQPKTFELIAWPYSKDDQRVFNGNLPMEVDDIDGFQVTKTTEGRSYTTKLFFITNNQDYQWLDTLSIKGIVVNESAEAKTSTEQFKGFRKVQ